MSEWALDYDATKAPTLARFLRSDAPARCVIGPFGSGKSSACCVEVVRRACETPVSSGGLRRSRWAVVRNTYPELRDTTIKTFKDWVPAALGRWRAQEHTFAMRFDDVDAEVMFRALDRPEDVKKLLSLELTGAYFNEAKEIPRAIFDVMQGRILRYPAFSSLPPGVECWHGIWMDTNPPDTDHWIYKLFEERKEELHDQGYRLFKQPGGRDPGAENLEHLVPGYYDKLAAGKSPDFVRVYVDGEYGFVMDGRPIYPEFKDSMHVTDVKPQPKWPILLGMDFGLTPAAALAQRDPKDGQLQVFAELVSEDMCAVNFARELARVIKAEYPGRKVRGHGDPAGEQRSQVDARTPFDVVQAAGLPVDPAPTNDFTLRREAVGLNLQRLTMASRPGLVIDPRCKVLRKAMSGGYCYRRLQLSGREAFADKPDKNSFSHVAEALQYLCVGEGEDRRAVGGGDADEAPTFRFKVRRSHGARL